MISSEVIEGKARPLRIYSDRHEASARALRG